MKPTRRTQPYRRGLARPPGGALTAMVMGRTLYGQNPQDVNRATAKMARNKQMQKRRRKALL
jgi:hypothetical protein